MTNLIVQMSVEIYDSSLKRFVKKDLVAAEDVEAAITEAVQETVKANEKENKRLNAKIRELQEQAKKPAFSDLNSRKHFAHNESAVVENKPESQPNP